ncbi:hypothetical protein [Microbacterium sp.]|uniref:hypothetical protein n=1 Tax=Microbacterium sp. TaxID=51671 RepID=UPI002BC60802|nr:hypothetical protein [Microbacterium sp.]HWL75930.1 hypothetical protein [Microbacterium sp.]
MSAPVFTQVAGYRVAIAELPLSAERSDEAAGAVVAIDGGGEWWSRASDAVDAGAAGVVVARPAFAPSGALDALGAHAGATPLVAERPLLRSDVAAKVVEAFATVPAYAAAVVECHAPAGAIPTALRDAVGWVRELSRSHVTVAECQTSSGRSVALLETADGGVWSLLAAAQHGAPRPGRIRITSLAETVVEVDDDGGDVSASVTDAAGRRVLPASFERPERLALRRAIDATQTAVAVSDLEALRHDTAIVETILAGRRASACGIRRFIFGCFPTEA